MCVSGVLLAVVIGVGLGLLIGALLFTILLLKNKYVLLRLAAIMPCLTVSSDLEIRNILK